MLHILSIVSIENSMSMLEVYEKLTKRILETQNSSSFDSFIYEKGSNVVYPGFECETCDKFASRTLKFATR